MLVSPLPTLIIIRLEVGGLRKKHDKTENKTYWDHLEIFRKQQSTNMSIEDVLEEFKNKGQLTPSQISDAKIRTDGTLTFM